MSKRSFRTSPKYEQLEAEILAHYGITGESQKELYEKLMEILHEKIAAVKDGTLANEAVTDDTVDCTHLVSYEGTKRKIFLCVWRPPSIDITFKDPTNGKTFVICKGSPVKFKTLPSLKICHSCTIQCPAAQSYRQPMREIEEDADTELEKDLVNKQETQASKVVPASVQQPAEEVFIPVMHWIPNMRSDGSKMCPFTAEMVYVLKQCKDCKVNQRKRYSACIDLFYQAEKERKSKASSAIEPQKQTTKW